MIGTSESKRVTRTKAVHCVELREFFSDSGIPARAKLTKARFQTVLFFGRLTKLSKVDAIGRMDHNKMTNVSHAFFILDRQINVRAPGGMIRVLGRLMMFVRNRSEHRIDEGDDKNGHHGM